VRAPISSLKIVPVLLIRRTRSTARSAARASTRCASSSPGRPSSFATSASSFAWTLSAKTGTIPIDPGEPRPQADYAADRAALSSSRSFSAAILVQCFAIRSKNFRSSELLVFEAYHSHWRAFSAHSAIVIAHPRLGATLQSESKCLLRNAYVTGITGLSNASDLIIPLNAERPRNLRRAFGTAPEEWPDQKLVRSSALR